MIYAYIAVMAVTTYLLRAVPLTLWHKPIRSRFLRSFLHYVPYACLAAMTFPAILYATNSEYSALAALAVTVVLAFQGKSLITVSVAGAATVFVVEWILERL